MKIIQRDNIFKFYWKKECPFCPNIDEDNVIWKGKYFFIQHAKYSYLWLKNHFLLVPYRHVIMTSELTKNEFSEFVEIEKFMENKYNWEDYFSFIRQSLSKDSRSVEHLHYHYLPWYITPLDLENILDNNYLNK